MGILLGSRMMRIGIGYDVHALMPNRKLVIGGVEIQFEKGLQGHSDADVLAHALIDSLLGAANLGDIGQHFPDNDKKYQDISSMHLLGETATLIAKAGCTLMNADAVIVAETPRMAPYLERMQSNMAQALNVEPTCIHVKATTQEGLGFIGAGDGIGAMCVALLTHKNR